MSEGEQKFLIEIVELLIRDAKRDVINRVLAIIDKRIEHNKPVSTLLQARAVSELNHIRHDILEGENRQ